MTPEMLKMIIDAAENLGLLIFGILICYWLFGPSKVVVKCDCKKNKEEKS